MNHSVTVWTANKADSRPIRGHCSCGTGGDFGGVDEAARYFGRHFSGLQGVCTFEFKDATTPTPEPETPPTAEPPTDPEIVVPVDPQPEVKPDDPEGTGTVYDVSAMPAQDSDRTSGMGQRKTGLYEKVRSVLPGGRSD